MPELEPHDPSPPIPRTVTFLEATRFWLKLGFISFGGPAGQIAIMHRELVERRRWLSEDRFLHALNYCMLLPGPEAQQLATYVGWLLHRVRGGLVAGGLFVLPSVFVLFGLSWAYAAHGETPVVAGLLYGFRPVVVAIVCEAVVRIGRRALKTSTSFGIAGLAFICIYFLNVPFPLIVIGAAVAGWLISQRGDRPAAEPSSAEPPAAATDTLTEELPLVIDDESPPAPHTRPSLRRAAWVVATGLTLWTAGYLLAGTALGFDSLHTHQYTYFTKAAFVTFGGAYAVLAYVSQAAVDTFGWLTPAQAVDGLALAETTPGPLIMVVQFVGFTAAWNHHGGLAPLESATLGAAITVFVTFLPCFLFIFLGAPYVEALRTNRTLNAALGGVTAAVVGVVLNLALVFGREVLLPNGWAAAPDPTALIITVVAFVALSRFSIDVLLVIIGGGLAGIALRLVAS